MDVASLYQWYDCVHSSHDWWLQYIQVIYLSMCLLAWSPSSHLQIVCCFDNICIIFANFIPMVPMKPFAGNSFLWLFIPFPSLFSLSFPDGSLFQLDRKDLYPNKRPLTLVLIFCRPFFLVRSVTVSPQQRPYLCTPTPPPHWVPRLPWCWPLLPSPLWLFPM